jgi:hypothetical protein
MNLAQLAEILRQRAPEEPAAKKRWLAAVDRLMEAAEPPDSLDELADLLPPKARYIGPGPWLDAIRDSYGQQ